MKSDAHIERMLERAGDFGPYQVGLMALFCAVNVVSAYHYFSQTFIGVAPQHLWCNTSTVWSMVSSSGGTMILNQSVVEAVDDYLSGLENKACTRYVDDVDPAKGGVPCDRGWIYDMDSGFQSIVTELNWVCGDDWKPVVGQSTFFVGSVLGTMTLGVLSDRIGRLPVLCAANALALAGNLLTAAPLMLGSGVGQFAAFRFVSGLATDCNFMMMYIIVMEYVRPSMRTFGLNLCIGVFYCLGCVTVPLIAIATGNWRTFLLVTSASIAVVVCYIFVLVLIALLASPALCQHSAYTHQPSQHIQVQPQYHQQVQQPQYHQYQGAATGGNQHGGQHHYYEEQHYDEHPKYEFHYKVEDEHTGDYKEQQETRDGDVVKGFYWLLDADGYRRMVEYSVDGKSGFQAKVTREPTGHQPVPPQRPHYQQHQQQPAPIAHKIATPILAAAPAHHAPVQVAQAPVHYAPVQVAQAPVHFAPAQQHFAPAQQQQQTYRAPSLGHYATAPLRHH